MRKEVFVVFIVLLFGLMVFSIDAEGDVEYIFGEFIGSGECGDVVGYELVVSFVDGRGLGFNHCVSRKEYVEDLSFVVESYVFRVEDSPNCPRGEQEGFIKDVNNELVLFCVVKGDADFVEDVSIGGECENGFEGGEKILVEGGEIVHCQKGGVLSEEEIVEEGGEGGGKGASNRGKVVSDCSSLSESECEDVRGCEEVFGGQVIGGRSVGGCELAKKFFKKKSVYAGCEGTPEETQCADCEGITDFGVCTTTPYCKPENGGCVPSSCAGTYSSSPGSFEVVTCPGAAY